MKYCKKCGTVAESNSFYCQECGFELVKVPSTEEKETYEEFLESCNWPQTNIEDLRSNMNSAMLGSKCLFMDKNNSHNN